MSRNFFEYMSTVQFLLRAITPPTIPSIAPMKKPPVPIKLKIENARTITPNVFLLD